MIIRYKHGFEVNGYMYGWRNKNLYRLPQVVKKRFYPLKKIKQIKVGSSKGYHVGRVKKSMSQLEAMTILINFKHQRITDKDCPS